MERAVMQYEFGDLQGARKTALSVKGEESGYREAQELVAEIDRVSVSLAMQHIALGEAYEDAGLYAIAAKEYQKALKLFPSNVPFHKRIRALKEKKKYPTRRNLSRFKKVKSLQVEPEAMADAHYEKGRVYLEAGDYLKAIDEFKIAMAIVPSFKDSDELLKLAKEEATKRINLHLERGIYHFQREELEEAVLEWDIVLKLDPKNSVAKDYRARAIAIIERLKKIREEQTVPIPADKEN